MIKVVFFGTPHYVLPVLTGIHKKFKTHSGESPITAVVTQPPRPAGRNQKLSYSPIDTWAHKRKIPILFDSRKLLENKIRADLGVLASYGAIIPENVLDHFPNGILNIHPSLLPKWRGAAPVQATIAAGDKEAGSTIIKIDELMDHGPIVSQFTEEIKKDDTTETLRERLFERSAEVLVELIDPYLKGKINLRKQKHNQATFTKLIKKNDAFIPPEILNAALQGTSFKGKWEIAFMKTKSSQASLMKDLSIQPTPQALERFIRAMIPWPVAWSKIRIKNQELRIKILKAHIEKSKVLKPDEVQLEGKNPVSWEQFRKAYDFSF